MGLIYLLLAKLAAVVKMIAVKQCGTIASGPRNSIKINLIRSLGSFLVSLLVFLFAGKQMDPVGLWIAIFAGAACAVQVFVWILTVERTSMSLTEIFCMLGSVVLPLIAAPFLYAGETVSLLQWIGALILVLSVFCFTPRKASGEKLNAVTVLLLLLCALTNAGVSIAQKLYVSYSVGSVAFYNLISFAVMAFFFAVLFCAGERKTEQRTGYKDFSAKIWFFIVLATVMLYTNQFFQTQASGYFTSAILYPLSYGIGIPLTFLTDVFVFHEKATKTKLLGVFLAVIAMIFVNL